MLVAFVLFMVMHAPLGVIAHHDNEAEHAQTAVSVGGESPFDSGSNAGRVHRVKDATYDNVPFWGV